MNGAIRPWLAAGFAVTAGVIPWRGTELGFAVHSAWSSPGTVVIGDSTAMRHAWFDLFPAAPTRPVLPGVQFATTRVVVVAAGSKPTGGYTVRFDSARVVRDSAMIWVSLRTPPPGCGVTQEITSPAVAIAIPRRPAPVRVITRERADTARCDRHT